MGRALDWDTWGVDSVSDSVINLSNAPLLCGLVNVNGLDEEITTTEKWAEKEKHTEKTVFVNIPRTLLALREVTNLEHQATDRSCCQHVSVHQRQAAYLRPHPEWCWCYMQMTITALYIHPMKQGTLWGTFQTPASKPLVHKYDSIWGYSWGLASQLLLQPGAVSGCLIGGELCERVSECFAWTVSYMLLAVTAQLMTGILRNTGYYPCFPHNILIFYKRKESYNKVALWLQQICFHPTLVYFIPKCLRQRVLILRL